MSNLQVPMVKKIIKLCIVKSGIRHEYRCRFVGIIDNKTLHYISMYGYILRKAMSSPTLDFKETALSRGIVGKRLAFYVQSKGKKGYANVLLVTEEIKEVLSKSLQNTSIVRKRAEDPTKEETIIKQYVTELKGNSCTINITEYYKIYD